MWRRLGSVLLGVLLGAACTVLAIFLYREGIIRAGAWAGVIGLLGIPIALVAVWLAWPRDRDAAKLPEQESRLKVQYNKASQHSSTFAVQDGNQGIYYSRPTDNTPGTPQQKNGGEEE
jgi:hypothetical protein